MNYPAKLAEFAAKAFKAACLAELEAIKPGNVHIFADGHGMVVQDFLQSAEAAAQVIAVPELGVGERIFRAVQATRQEVGNNTNLGIVLLCAPLIHASLHGDSSDFRQDLLAVLNQLSVEDAELAFQAILLASPGGLGASDEHDVHDRPQVTLLEAMQYAQERDHVARQYATGYGDVFDFGLPRYRELLDRWGRPAWATTGTYLSYLAEFPDTHIVRKHGIVTATKTQSSAQVLLHKMLELENPKLCFRDLLHFDGELKSNGLNPGTSADLTVATLLADTLQRGVG